MNTVNELKKLLQPLDVEKIRSSLFEASTLESLNWQSEKLNQLVLSGGGGSCQEEDDNDCEIVFEGAKEAKRSDQDVLEISPGVDGTRVKTFEELVKLKLKQGERAEQQQQQQLRQLRNPFKVQSTEKRPFLKRGEGLRRFSKGGTVVTSPKMGDKTEASTTKKSSLEGTPQVTAVKAIVKTNDKPKSCEAITENLAGKEQPRLRQEDATEKRKCTKKRTDFSRKVLPISRAQNLLTMTESVSSVDGQQQVHQPEFPQRLNTVDIIHQIGHLEKRLLDLMTLKGQLTTGEQRIFEFRGATEVNSAPSEHLASSIELIRAEIAALNSKVSSLATEKPRPVSASVDYKVVEEEEEEEGGEDKNSRHLEATEDEASRASESAASYTSTLSNGDKIAFASDQSITYMHGNGTSQTLYRDGLKVIRFPNGQIEKLHPDGSKEITYADDGQQHQQQRRLMIKRRTTADGNGSCNTTSEEIIHLADGTVHSRTADGRCQRTVYPNGDVEWQTEEYTRRHFSAGHIKTQYANGCSETIFSSGRVRLKDRQGNVLFDRRP